MPETMKAVVLTSPGGADALQLTNVPLPQPGPGQVRVRVAASGVNRADLLQRQGRYKVPEGWPTEILGMEFAGEIDALGDGVDAWKVGDRVMGILGGGGYAEQALTWANQLVAAPSGMDLVEAAAIPEVFMTAFDAMVLQGGLKSGENLLVHAVGSGVGTAGMQLGRYFGARVIGTSRTQEKLDRAVELGLEFPVIAGESWEERVTFATDGIGVDLILDLVGGPYLSRNIIVLAEKGRIVVVGVTGGPKAPFNLRSLMVKRGTIIGTVLRSRPWREKEMLTRAFAEKVLPGFDDGSLKPVLDQTFAPDAAADAHRRMEANLNFGKLLIVW